MITHILVPVDGSEHARRAVDLAGSLARHYGAALTLVHVSSRTGTPTMPHELEQFAKLEQVWVSEQQLIDAAANDLVQAARERAIAAGARDPVGLVEHGDPAGRIAALARDSAVDLIVMGRRGLGDFAGLLLGSVSHKVAHLVDCNCLTVK